LAEHLARELGEPVVVEGLLAALAQVGLDAQRELVRPDRGDARRHQRAGEQALRVRELVLAGERAGIATRSCHSGSLWPAGPRSHASGRASGSRVRVWTSAVRRSSKPSATTSLRANTTSAPRSRACCATTSIAAAFSSTR